MESNQFDLSKFIHLNTHSNNISFYTKLHFQVIFVVLYVSRHSSGYSASYIYIYQAIRQVMEAASPKKYLITVAPGWPQYTWDKRAIGVVDTFNCMSYSNTGIYDRLDLLTEVDYYHM